MTAFGTAYTITTSANGTISGNNQYLNTVVCYNNGTAAVSLGAASTGTNGYLLYTGGSVAFTLEQGETLYAFVAAGTADLRVLGNTGSR